MMDSMPLYASLFSVVLFSVLGHSLRGLKLNISCGLDKKAENSSKQ